MLPPNVVCFTEDTLCLHFLIIDERGTRGVQKDMNENKTYKIERMPPKKWETRNFVPSVPRAEKVSSSRVS